MKPTIGRIVCYVLSEQDAFEINRRRTTSEAIARRVGNGTWPNGAQAHIGNSVQPGEILPAFVVRVWGSDETSSVNLQVFLDGNDTFWACSRNPDAFGAPGTWHWPVRVLGGGGVENRVLSGAAIRLHLATIKPTCPACHSKERVTVSPPESRHRGAYFCPCNEPGGESVHFDTITQEG